MSKHYVFTQRNFVAVFLQAKCDFTRKTAVLRFRARFGGYIADELSIGRLVTKLADFE